MLQGIDYQKDAKDREPIAVVLRAWMSRNVSALGAQQSRTYCGASAEASPGTSTHNVAHSLPSAEVDTAASFRAHHRHPDVLTTG